MILYLLLELLRGLFKVLPAVIAYFLADIVGDVVYYLWPRGRRNMIRSIANLLDNNTSEKEVRNMARHCIQNYCKFLVDTLRYYSPPEDFFTKRFQISGLENLESARAKGHGVILVSFHLGNLDLGVRFLSHLGYPVNAVVHNLSSGQLDRFVQKSRSRDGLKLIGQKDSPSRLFEALRRNEVLAIMMDYPDVKKGVLVKLGRQMVRIPTAPFTLALRTGAVIVPACLVRTSNTTFKGVLNSPIELKPGSRSQQDISEFSQRVVESLEKMARLYLEQWYIFHPLIKDNLRDQDGRAPGL